MLVDHIPQVDIGDDIAVAEQHVFGVVVADVAQSPLERLQAAPIDPSGLAAGKGRQQHQPAPFAGQVPWPSGTHMVHQGLVVHLGDDANIRDVRVDHAGEHKIDQAVAAAIGDATRGPVGGQAPQDLIVHIGEDDPHYLVFPHHRTP